MTMLVSNTLELLDKEIPRLRDKIQSVQLCFTTDPFMEGYPEVSQMSIAAIRKLNEAGIKCTTLTKGLLPIELAELSPENEYGITLITLDGTDGTGSCSLCRPTGSAESASRSWLQDVGEHRTVSNTEHDKSEFTRNLGSCSIYRQDHLRQNELQQNGKCLPANERR